MLATNNAIMGEHYDHWLRSCSVLLVEECQPDATRYQGWLADAGATVTAVRSSAQASNIVGGRFDEFDLAVVGARSSADPSLELADRLKWHQPGCALLVQSANASNDLIARVKHLGAAYLSKTAARADFMFTTSKLLEREVPNLELLTARAQKRWRLSRQQARVLYYNLWSCSNDEIARFLGVSLHTVQEYQQKLRRKTGARTKDGYLRRLLECSGRRPPEAPDASQSASNRKRPDQSDA